MTDEGTYRQKLYKVALGQHGYVTSRDATSHGVPRIELTKIGRRQGVSRRGYGVYRFDDYPVEPLGSYMEAVLLVGHDAFIIDESVLAMHDLALVNPPRIRVGTGRRVRRTSVPSWVEVVQVRIDPSDLTVYEGVPSTTLARAFLDSRGRVMLERLVEGVADARARGLISSRAAATVLRELDR